MQLPTLSEMRDEFERDVLMGRLAACGWNETMSAETLGISRSQLQNLRRKHGITRPFTARPMVRKEVREIA